MRILQINTVVNSGSTGRIAEDIGNQVIESGNESFIAFGRGGGASSSYLLRIGNKCEELLHGLQTILLDRHGLGSYGATTKLVGQIREIKPDIIHLHNIHGYYLHYGVLFNFLNEYNKPVIWTLHDSWSFTGHCTYFDNINCERWKTGCFSCPKKRKYPKSLLIDRSEANFQDKRRYFNSLKKLIIVTPSHWLASLVKESFLKFHNLKVIHNAIDTDLFSPDVYFNPVNKFPELKGKKIVLGVASIWDTRKGLADFIELSKVLPDEYNIVLIGINASQRKAIPQKVIAIERTENINELAGWYSSSFMFLNPTYQDNFPTTNIEALSCGTPVITYKTGGSPEAIDANTGIVLNKGDLKGVLRALDKFNNLDINQIRVNCRERALSYFNKKKRYKEYLDLYQRMIEKIVV